MASHDCRVGNEVEITYRLEYKMAEVARLPDAASYSHVATSIGNDPNNLPGKDVEATFSVTRQHTKVTQDDQLITFTTRVKGMPDAESEVYAVPVTAWFSNGQKIAPGEKAVDVAQLNVKKG